MVTDQRLVDAFVGFADTLVAEFDTIDFLHTLAETTVELLDADAAGLMLADQRGDLQVVASSSEEARLLEIFELQHDEGPCLDCYRGGRAVTNVDPDEAERRWPRLGAAIRDAHFMSVHALPLRLRNEVIGSMNIFLARPGTLSEADIALGQGLADIATIGLLQQRAIQEHRVLAEQLQGALNTRVLVEQAKGVLAERQGMEMTAAFTVMRSYARRTGRPLRDIAAGIIDGSLTGAVLQGP